MKADVAVVGGGPAGSACALELARRGLDVIAIERAEFPRRKTCGEYLNAGAVRTLGELGVLERVRAKAASLSSIVMRDRHGNALDAQLCGESLSIARSELDAILSDEAECAGVRRVRGRVDDVVMRAGRACGVHYRNPGGENVRVDARFVVGADGARSLVARSLGVAQESPEAQRFALGGHFAGTVSRDRTLEMFVDGSSYLAINPLAGGRANVMLVVTRAQLAAGRDDVDGFVRSQGVSLGGRAIENATRIGERVSAGPLASRVSRPAAPGALLAGDAAGMIDPFTGQGVFIALSGGRAAADAIVAACDRPSTEEGVWRSYARSRSRDLVRRRLACRLVKTVVSVPFFARRGAAKFRRFPELLQPLLAAVSGIERIERALDPQLLVKILA